MIKGVKVHVWASDPCLRPITCTYLHEISAVLCYRSSLRRLKEKTLDSWRESEGCKWKQRLCNTLWKMRKKRYVLQMWRWHVGDFRCRTILGMVFISVFQVQKLQNIIASRASQYNHEMKRKEREFNKLKERLNQLLTDKREKKQGWLENELLPIYLKSLKALSTSNSQPLTPLAVSHWCVKQHWKSWWEEKPLENWQDWSKVSSWLTSPLHFKHKTSFTFLRESLFCVF